MTHLQKAYDEFISWWQGRKQFREIINKYITKKFI